MHGRPDLVNQKGWVIASVLRTSIRAPLLFRTRVQKAGNAWTDFLISFANMDRKLIAEPAILKGIFELRGNPMVAGGGPWGAKCAFSEISRNVGNYSTTRGG